MRRSPLQVLAGHRIRVDSEGPSSLTKDHKSSVFVGNVPFKATEDEVCVCLSLSLSLCVFLSERARMCVCVRLGVFVCLYVAVDMSSRALL
jgi:hypothetical protein